MIKTPVKFQKDQSKTVEVALTKYLLQTLNHAPYITLHAPWKAEYHVPSPFFEKIGDNNVYLCNPQFYYIKVAFKGGSTLHRHVFMMFSSP